MLPLILASASPRRKALLDALGVANEVRPSEVEEIFEGEPLGVAIHNAELKRDHIAEKLESPALVIGADTIVVLGQRILGKPRDLDEARSMLSDLSGKTHDVITGVAIVNTQTRQAISGAEVTAVTFRDLSPDDIDRFVDAVKPLDRAGAYTVDGPGTLIVERYEGCYQNVLGLPVPRLEAMLEELGESLFERMNPDAARYL